MPPSFDGLTPLPRPGSPAYLVHPMTNPFLSLENVSFVLPDGRTLFSGLTESFDRCRTGMVGRNGTGKTVLAQILAGTLAPSSGRCVRNAMVHYVRQGTTAAGGSVAELAGVMPIDAAMARIDTGNATAVDIECVANYWNVLPRLERTLAENGLGHLSPQAPAACLSGGESTRVALAGAMLSGADFLVLDEPTNHLDRDNRRALIRQLERWSKGLLVISHDRILLETMERVVELSSNGLQAFGGGYTFYAERKAAQRQGALQALHEQEVERRRARRAMTEQRERQARRAARGRRDGRTANQAPILLGQKKERSENTAGRLRRQHEEARRLLDGKVQQAARQLEVESVISMHDVALESSPKCIAELVDITLPFVNGATAKLDLVLARGQRIGLVGANGSGKSTLLRVLAGLVPPLQGQCTIYGSHSYLDQQLSNLDPASSVIEQLRTVNAGRTEHDLRLRLAHLGLDAGKVSVPSGALSGGEQIKAALALALYADTPAQLLLLDEPTNHLDLPSVLALERMLVNYAGTLLVASHDDIFLDNIALTHRLSADACGWQLETL